MSLQTWTIWAFAWITLLNASQAYAPSYHSDYAPVTPYPSQENWPKSDVEREHRGYYPSESNHGKKFEHSTTQTSASSVNTYASRQAFTSDTGIKFHNQDSNLRRGDYQQTGQHSQHFHRHHHKHYVESSEDEDQSASDDDEAVFKIRRNPDRTFSVMFNDTVISQPRPDGNMSISNRNSPGNVAGQRKDIVFPDDHRRKGTEVHCAESGKMFCTEVLDYPKDIIANALQNQVGQFEPLFGSDVVPELLPNIIQRIDAPGEDSLCTSTAKLIFPQAGLTKDNSWSLIVNQDNYTQGVRVEECVNPGKPCYMTESFPLGYTTECRQKFIYRQLVSITPEGRMVKDLFQLPSCCTCVLKQTTRL